MEIITQANIFLYVYLLLHPMRKLSVPPQKWLLLFVETPDFSVMSEENVKRLRSNICLAEQLGAKIETVYGEDVPFQIAEFTRLSGVSKIVIGRSSATKRHLLSKPTLTEKLIDYAPNLDVH